jgi:hypothetical protein
MKFSSMAPSFNQTARLRKGQASTFGERDAVVPQCYILLRPLNAEFQGICSRAYPTSKARTTTMSVVSMAENLKAKSCYLLQWDGHA